MFTVVMCYLNSIEFEKCSIKVIFEIRKVLNFAANQEESMFFNFFSDSTQKNTKYYPAIMKIIAIIQPVRVLLDKFSYLQTWTISLNFLYKLIWLRFISVYNLLSVFFIDHLNWMEQYQNEQNGLQNIILRWNWNCSSCW